MRKSVKVLAIAFIICTLFISCKPEPEHEHVFSIHHEAVAATCADGHTEYWECECGEKDDHYEVIPATGSHDFSATCPQGHEICAECGTASDGETIDNYVAKQSDWSIVNGKTVLIVKAECGCELIANAAIGSVGPAGGYIFYDVDADNTAEDPDGADDKASETCGWKYLEASKTLLGKDANGDYSIGEDLVEKNIKLIFGYYSEDGENISRIGITESGKIQGLGLGKSYTKTLCDNKDKLYKDAGLTGLATNLACVAVDSISITVNGVVFDDWYVPSTGEMVIYANSGLKAPFTSTQTLMTSTEAAGDDSFIGKFKGVEFTIGENNEITDKVSSRTRNTAMRIIPIRQF